MQIILNTFGTEKGTECLNAHRATCEKISFGFIYKLQNPFCKKSLKKLD